MSVLLDTHAALWLVQGDDRLTPAALSRLQELDRDEILVSDLMLFELALLITKRRLRQQRPSWRSRRETPSIASS